MKTLPTTVTVKIRDNETGEIHTITRTRHIDMQSFIDLWTDGNFGCDCNRSLFYHEMSPSDDDDISCGDTRYSVQLIDKATGEMILDEFNRD